MVRQGSIVAAAVGCALALPADASPPEWFLKAYAEVMNRFAAGERSINRVWSASTDGYIEETSDYLEKAAAHFEDALETFKVIKATGGLMMQDGRAAT